MHDPDRLDADTAAYHEAGHAVVAHRLGGEVVACTIEGDDAEFAGGVTVRWYDVSAAERTRRSALVALAGPLAEARWRGEPAPDDDQAWAADRRQVDAALAALPTTRDRAAALQRWLAEVATAFGDPVVWECVCRVADGLAAHGTLDRDLFLAAIGEEDPDGDDEELGEDEELAAPAPDDDE